MPGPSRRAIGLGKRITDACKGNPLTAPDMDTLKVLKRGLDLLETPVYHHLQPNRL